MRRFLISLTVLALVLAACGNTGSSGAPTGVATVAPTTAATAAPSVAPTTAATAAPSVAPASIAPETTAPKTPEASAPASVGAPTPTPQITQPPAVVLADKCAAGGAPSPAPNAVNAWAAGISGDVTISGWQSTGAEGDLVTQTLCAAQAALPNIHITYQPIAGDYPAVMTANIAARDVPDLFYVNADYAQSWIDQTYLLPLDDYIAKSSFDTSKFFEGYASIFKGTDGKTYGFPKDGNTIGMAYNTDMVATPPTTMDELATWAKDNIGKAGNKAPLCLNPGLDRGLAFLYAQGGSLLNADGTASAIETDASKTAIQWYMDLFKSGAAMTASDMGDGWCGEALGKGDAAVVFEGGWVDPFMTSTYPTINYKWAPVPTGTSGSPVTIAFTVSYSIGADAKNPDQAFALLSYLTGADGMKVWTDGGLALPSRSDVTPAAGLDVLSQEAAYAKPGSGFMPAWGDVQAAFQNEFVNQLQTKSYDATTVIDKTKAAIDKAFAGQ